MTSLEQLNNTEKN